VQEEESDTDAGSGGLPSTVRGLTLEEAMSVALAHWTFAVGLHGA